MKESQSLKMCYQYLEFTEHGEDDKIDVNTELNAEYQFHILLDGVVLWWNKDLKKDQFTSAYTSNTGLLYSQSAEAYNQVSVSEHPIPLQILIKRLYATTMKVIILSLSKC